MTAMAAKTFVLVHGAWHGGWCWQRVATLLRREGHSVFTPTLTGLGERSHLLGPGVDLATHISDVVNVFKWERLERVVLCGHSYGGMVISGVAEQMEAAIGTIVFLDAFVPQNGQALFDATSAATRERILTAAANNEIAVSPPAAKFFHVNEQDQAWVDALCGPHPIKTLTDKIALSGARERIARKAYVRAQKYPNPAFDKAYETLKADPAWRTYGLPCGHDVMVDMPERLAEILLEVA